MMPVLYAEERLRDPNLNVTADGKKALVLAATGDRKRAEEAWTAQVEADLIAGRKPQ